MIDYVSLVRKFLDGADFMQFLFDELPDLWCQEYKRVPGDAGAFDIVQLQDHGYEFLFDLGEERVVAAFGRSRRTVASRDRSRMSGFLGRTTARQKLAALPPEQARLADLTWRDRFLETHGAKYDRGHFISHLQGGGLDINLFPQLAEVNRGTCPEGVAYRAMETICADHPGTFCFSRPIYDDRTWLPSQLEYGVMRGPEQMDVRAFPNKRQDRAALPGPAR